MKKQKEECTLHINVKILSRSVMAAHIRARDIAEAAVVSFYDRNPLDFGDACKRVFRVHLYDLGADELAEYGLTYDSFFPEAEELAVFLQNAAAEGRTILCQCEFGMSRSAACAAALLEYYEGNGISVFADFRYCPNQLVFRKLYDALRRENAGDSTSLTDL